MRMVSRTGANSICIFCTVFIVLGLPSCSRKGEVRLQKLIEEHQSRHPDFKVQDAYKLIYQNVFGVAHILEDRVAAGQYLQREYNSVEPSTDEPLLEAISLDGEVVRVNLRPFKAVNGPLDTLFEVMVQSAEEIHGTEEDFQRLWDAFKSLIKEGKLTFDQQVLEEFDTKVRAAHYPPVHHSDGYGNANHPSYRVVKRTIFKNIFSPLQ